LSEHSRKLVNQRREIKLKMNASKTRSKKIELQARYSALDKEVKKNIQNYHQKWTDDKAEKAEAVANRGGIKELYHINKLLSKNKFNSSGPVRNKGRFFVTAEKEQFQRWKEYFNEILNQGLESQESELGAAVTDETVVEINPSAGTHIATRKLLPYHYFTFYENNLP
jgi:hypothetical protein